MCGQEKTRYDHFKILPENGTKFKVGVANVLYDLSVTYFCKKPYKKGSFDWLPV